MMPMPFVYKAGAMYWLGIQNEPSNAQTKPFG